MPSIIHRSRIRDTLAAALCMLAGVCVTAHANDVLLITDHLQVSHAELVELQEDGVVYVDPQQGWQTIPKARVIGFLDEFSTITSRRRSGMLHLVDGQIVPGTILSNATGEQNAIVWNHPWISRIEVPLDQVAAVLVSAQAVIPEPGEGDVVVLANGDRLEGLIVEIGNPVVLEVNQSGETINIPLDRVQAVRLVSRPIRSTNQRAWFRDGSVLDVRSIRMSDDGLLRITPQLSDETTETEMPINRVAGVLFDPTALVPLASMRVLSVQGPPTRYRIPPPSIATLPEALELRDIELRGPLSVTWRLPDGATRFATQAILPEDAQVWGDFDLVIRVDNSERFRQRISSDQPVIDVNMEVRDGSELTIEISEGRYSSIQDHLMLRRAMILTR